MSLVYLKEKLISFIYDDACCFCKHELVRAESELDRLVCPECYQNCVGDILDRCYFCSGPVTFENPFGSRCRMCRNWSSQFERAYTIGHYTGALRDLILGIKREFDDVQAYQLGQLLASICERLDLPAEIDCVVPVPSHWQRRLGRRGLNVTEVIAEGFCRSSGMKLHPALRCTRHSSKQSKLSPHARKKNISGAFAIRRGKSVRNMQVLLLDDVMTSGATVSECTRQLIQGLSLIHI